MSRTGSPIDFDHFDEWETIDLDDDIYAGTESDLYSDEWEDDGAIAQVREPFNEKKNDLGPDLPLELDESSGQVLSLLEKANAKRESALEGIKEPSEDELSTIEEVGIDEYIDAVLSEEEDQTQDSQKEPLSSVEEPSFSKAIFQSESAEASLIGEENIYADEEVELVVKPFFEGVACSLPTLFDEDGEVEYKTTARLAKRIIENGSTAIFAATLDGEGATLSRKERKNLVANIAKVIDVPLVVDITSPSVRQSVQLASDVIDAGATALVVEITKDVKDPYRLCESIHSAHKNIPIIIRLSGAAEDLPISPEFLYDLPINGVIDATGDAGFFIHLNQTYSGPIYIGSIPILAMAKVIEAQGAVLSCAAIDTELVNKAFNGDYGSIIELSTIERDFGGITPLRIKQSLETDMLISPTVRD